MLYIYISYIHINIYIYMYICIWSLKLLYYNIIYIRPLKRVMDKDAVGKKSKKLPLSIVYDI